jgi:hypothetical protein
VGRSRLASGLWLDPLWRQHLTQCKMKGWSTCWLPRPRCNEERRWSHDPTLPSTFRRRERTGGSRKYTPPAVAGQSSPAFSSVPSVYSRLNAKLASADDCDSNQRLPQWSRRGERTGTPGLPVILDRVPRAFYTVIAGNGDSLDTLPMLSVLWRYAIAYEICGRIVT